jgi:glycosyltransferase involved in cell wall biosynthesis
MIILTTSYNCEKYIERSLLSIMGQRFRDFTCYITDDLSEDGTVEVIKKTIAGDDRFVLIENKTKMFQPGNYDQVIRGLNIPDDEICVEVDGDDWLANSNVLGLINETYTNPDVWMTSGSFKYSNGVKGFATLPKNFNNIRKQNFTLSHLRTWKSWLWKKIKEEDLKDSEGFYWSVAGDLSFMFPMFEMSGEKHYHYIPDLVYVYNEQNPLNDHKVNMPDVKRIVDIIRAKEEYQLL